MCEKIDVSQDTESFICNSLGISLETLEKITEKDKPKTNPVNEESQESIASLGVSFTIGFITKMVANQLAEQNRIRAYISPMTHLYSNISAAIKSDEFFKIFCFALSRIKTENYRQLNISQQFFNKHDIVDVKSSIMKNILMKNNSKIFNNYSVYLYTKAKQKNYIVFMKSSKIKTKPGEIAIGGFYVYFDGVAEAPNVYADGAYRENGLLYTLRMQLFTVFKVAEVDRHIYDGLFEYNASLLK